MNTVLITGAGTSVHTGIPTMATFWQQADKVCGGDLSKELSLLKRAQAVFRGLNYFIGSWLPGRELQQEDIEMLFAYFEMAEIVGLFGELNSQEIMQLRKSLETVVSATVERTWNVTLRGETWICPSPAFHKLGMAAAKTGTVYRLSGIITFNYDLNLELGLLGATSSYQGGIHVEGGAKINYGLDTFTSIDGGTRSIASDGLPVLKLHGSLNWFDGDPQMLILDPAFLSDLNYPALMRDEPDMALRRKLPLKDVTLRQATARELRIKELHQMIIYPSPSKRAAHKGLAPVWAAATQLLSEADRIVICGYSLPASDQFFDLWLGLAMSKREQLPDFAVVDLSAESIVKRLRAIFNNSREPAVRPYNTNFESCDIEKILTGGRLP